MVGGRATLIGLLRTGGWLLATGGMSATRRSGRPQARRRTAASNPDGDQSGRGNRSVRWSPLGRGRPNECRRPTQPRRAVAEDRQDSTSTGWYVAEELLEVAA